MTAFILAAALLAQTPPPQQTPKPSPSPATSPTPSPAPAANVTGKWTMTLELTMGTATPTLELIQTGEKITGSYEGRYGKSQLTGTIKNRVIEFSFTMSAEGTDTLMAYKGQVAADFKSMHGTAELGGMGEASWSAVPKK